MEKLLETIAKEKGIGLMVVEEILKIECRLVYKKKRHFRGDFKDIITAAVEAEVKKQ